MNYNKLIIVLVLMTKLWTNMSFGGSSLDFGNQVNYQWLSARQSLTQEIKNTENNFSKTEVDKCITQADACIRSCDDDIEKKDLKSRIAGVVQIKGQAMFLKKFLVVLQNVINKKRLSKEDEECLEKADRYYKGEVGNLFLLARKTIENSKQQETPKQMKELNNAILGNNTERAE